MEIAGNFGRLEVVHYLAKQEPRAVLDMQNKDQETAMCLACHKGYAEIVEVITSFHGAMCSLLRVPLPPPLLQCKIEVACMMMWYDCGTGAA